MKNERNYKGLPKSFKQVFYEEYRRFPTFDELVFAKNEIIINKLYICFE
jgi:hypothetical protein